VTSRPPVLVPVAPSRPRPTPPDPGRLALGSSSGGWPTSELHRLKYFTETLIAELRDVDDTDEVRTELGGLCDGINHEMSQRPVLM
jgi:hypothetical protein